MTAQIKKIMEHLAAGSLDKDRFTSELVNTISTQLKVGMQEGLHRLGPLQSAVLVERKQEGENRAYRYRVVYKDAVLLALAPSTKRTRSQVWR